MGFICKHARMDAVKFRNRMMGVIRQNTRMGLMVSNPEMMMPLLITTPLRPRVRSQLPLPGVRVLF